MPSPGGPAECDRGVPRPPVLQVRLCRVRIPVLDAMEASLPWSYRVLSLARVLAHTLLERANRTQLQQRKALFPEAFSERATRLELVTSSLGS